MADHLSGQVVGEVEEFVQVDNGIADAVPGCMAGSNRERGSFCRSLVHGEQLVAERLLEYAARLGGGCGSAEIIVLRVLYAPSETRPGDLRWLPSSPYDGADRREINAREFPERVRDPMAVKAKLRADLSQAKPGTEVTRGAGVKQARAEFQGPASQQVPACSLSR